MSDIENGVDIMNDCEKEEALAVEDAKTIEDLIKDFNLLAIRSSQEGSVNGDISRNLDEKITLSYEVKCSSSVTNTKNDANLTEIIRSPITSSQFVAFKKALKDNDVVGVRDKVLLNTSYLMNERDLPQIYQHHFRHNALHLAAASGQYEMVELILDLLDSNELYTRAGIKKELDFNRDHLLDFYLNSPDTNFCTPLHLAVYKGYAHCCRIILSHPRTVLSMRDKNKNTAYEVAFKLNQQNIPGSNEVLNVFKEHYVVLLSKRHLLEMPVVKTVSLRELFYLKKKFMRERYPEQPPIPSNRPKFADEYEEIIAQQEDCSRLDAYAGPMSLNEALAFQKMWKNPKLYPKMSNQFIKWRKADIDEGYFKQGAKLAGEMRLDWFQYLPFLDKYANLNDKGDLFLLNQGIQNAVMKLIAEYEFSQFTGENTFISEKKLSTLEYYKELKSIDTTRIAERQFGSFNPINIVSSAFSRIKTISLTPINSALKQIAKNDDSENRRIPFLLSDKVPEKIHFIQSNKKDLSQTLWQNIRIYQAISPEKLDNHLAHLLSWYEDFSIYQPVGFTN